MCNSEIEFDENLSQPSRKILSQLSAVYQSSTDRYTLCNGLLIYLSVSGDTPRVVVTKNGDLRLRIMYEYHYAPVGGNRDREKTCVTVSREFYWPHQYQFVHKYARACEVCQRVKSTPSLRALLHHLPIPNECWKSISMDFVFGFSTDTHKDTDILVFVDRFSKMIHLVAVPESINAMSCARLYRHDLPPLWAAV